MLKKLTSVLLACAISVCSVGNFAHAAPNEETAKKIAAIFAEQEEKSQQKLNIEAGKRQKLEDENKALLEELRKLKAEKENKELQQKINALKKQKESSKQESIWAVKDFVRGICVVGGVLAAGFATVAGLAGIGAGTQSAYQCYNDPACSFKASETECKRQKKNILGDLLNEYETIPCNTWPDKFKGLFGKWFSNLGTMFVYVFDIVSRSKHEVKEQK